MEIEKGVKYFNRQEIKKTLFRRVHRFNHQRVWM